jgi:hypothetical protein
MKLKEQELSEMKDKIIELYEADNKILALTLARSIMTDKKVMEFCMANPKCFNNNYSDYLDMSILINDVDNSFELTMIHGILWLFYHPSPQGYETYFIPKDDKAIVRAFNKFLNLICGNKRQKK